MYINCSQEEQERRREGGSAAPCCLCCCCCCSCSVYLLFKTAALLLHIIAASRQQRRRRRRRKLLVCFCCCCWWNTHDVNGDWACRQQQQNDADAAAAAAARVCLRLPMCVCVCVLSRLLMLHVKLSGLSYSNYNSLILWLSSFCCSFCCCCCAPVNYLCMCVRSFAFVFGCTFRETRAQLNITWNIKPKKDETHFVPHKTNARYFWIKKTLRRRRWRRQLEGILHSRAFNTMFFHLYTEFCTCLVACLFFRLVACTVRTAAERYTSVHFESCSATAAKWRNETVQAQNEATKRNEAGRNNTRKRNADEG